ncbi:MAG TPA: DUF4430 domain-containing protein [Prolixibacteraceae bacterium]|nr:DUF4430 domain-containing protein [Prolixibacteraceae bacterium]
MRRTVILSFIIFAIAFVGQAKEKKPSAPKPIIVEIDFGNGHEVKRVDVACNKTITALEALQKAADVKTHPVGSYVFVTSIDEVAAERGKMAWYYKVNGKKPKLAIEQPVKPGDTVSWRFVEDVCSKKVDGPTK